MPDADDKIPAFDDLDLPEGELAMPEPLGGLAPPETAATEPLLPEGPEGEPETPKKKREDRQAAKAAAKEAKAAAKAEKAAAKAARTAEKAAQAAAKKETLQPKQRPKRRSAGVVKSLVRSSPYTVALAIALLAMVIGIFCLVMELGMYGFDVKARQGALLPAAQSPAAQSGPASTTAAA